jgi:hypothetical protein
MKARILFLSISIFSLTVFFTSCVKTNNNKDDDYTTEANTHSDDQSRVSGEVDAVANDADVVLESTAGFFARVDRVQGVICDATVTVDTMSNPRTITIVYNGTNCLGARTRTGTVILSMPAGIRWKNAGAAITVTYQNFKVTRVIDNKSITINGSKTYTNVSGGLLINLPNLTSITHTITSSNLSVTFDNGTQRTWQMAHQRVYTFNNGVVITSTGTKTDGALTGIAEWGTSRFGRAFTTQITQPVIIRQDCSFRITAGEVKHTVPLFTSSAKFGLDVNGNATGCPGLGNYYMRISWTGNAGGTTHSVILPY